MKRLCYFFGLLLMSHLVWAGDIIKSQDLGDYIVHYNAFTTDTLSPQIAHRYRLSRGSDRGLLNITLLKKVLGSPNMPTASRISASATNLTGQLKNLDVREVRDGPAIYYLAEFKVSDKETLDFKIKIQPFLENKVYEVKFRQQFFTK